MTDKPAILITGSAKRIGAAAAKHFAAKGWAVAVHYQSSAGQASALKAEIEVAGGTCEIFGANLANVHETEALIPAVAARFPNLSVLINNASRFPRVSFKDTSPELLDEMLAVHVKAPFILGQAFADLPQARSIINMVDSKVRTTQNSHFAYLLSKKALLDLTHMLARDLAPKVQVHAICPGAVLAAEDGSDADYLAKRAAQSPTGKTASVEDIIQGMEYLATDCTQTGQVLWLDGGEHTL